MRVWERQEGESAKAYEAFAAYRDLGPDRSLPAAYRQRYGKKPAAGGVPGYFLAWSSAHRWVERCRLYDAHLEEQALAELEGEWIQRRNRVRDTEWSISERLMERLEGMLEHPLTEEVVEEDDEDGLRVTTIKPSRWTLNTARLIAESISKLQRLATGQATSRNELTGPDGGPISIQQEETLDLSDLTDDELATIEEILARARSRSRDT